ncbi:MAG: UDP-N-acetylmuramate dehydrogenase [Pseudomonadales bacterium]|nr:UDP-N-acetylmuramate dehydrogenase [Pseudomonadales bacterium]
MIYEEDISLLGLNTLGLNVQARQFCRVESLDQLKAALLYARQNSSNVFIMGGGSNVVLAEDIDALVILVGLKGITYTGSEVTVMAGENWHDFVRDTLAKGFSGLENLSLIPGLVGAAPVQNIGAYGVDLAERLVALTVIDRASGEVRVLSNEECDFSYRSSIFKTELLDQCVITSITLSLDIEFSPRLEYADLIGYAKGSLKMTAQSLSDAIIDIRQRKLPSLDKYGNVGSFFKNPEISIAQLDSLKAQITPLRALPLPNGRYRMPAAILLDTIGLKGLRQGGAGVSTEHALVIVNLGGATGSDVVQLANQVILRVNHRFNIRLEIEPVIVAA